MRSFGRAVILVSIAVGAAGMAVSQQPPPGGPFGKGKGQPVDEMSLFQNPQVRAELKITDQQLANLPCKCTPASR
jgi:hypothetical protein